MAHITIGNVQDTHRRCCSPTILLDVIRDDGSVGAQIGGVIPDPGAEASVGGRDVMAALGLSEKDLAASSFDQVMANRSSPLLSIGQRDINVRYGDRSAHITIVFCPEIRGMLLCRLDCVELNILHRQYPKPVSGAFGNVCIAGEKLTDCSNFNSIWRDVSQGYLHPYGAYRGANCDHRGGYLSAEFEVVFDQEEVYAKW